MNSELKLPGSCRFFRLNSHRDSRGALVPIEAADAGFQIARVYYIYGLSEDVERGFHAHRRLRQLAVAVRGSCTIELDDGTAKASVPLTDPRNALTIEPMVWHTMRHFSGNCLLLVLASGPYDETDYIRDYGHFLSERVG